MLMMEGFNYIVLLDIGGVRYLLVGYAERLDRDFVLSSARVLVAKHDSDGGALLTEETLRHAVSSTYVS
jgi:hypothetical protein